MELDTPIAETEQSPKREHYLENINIRALIEKYWRDCLPLLESLTTPEPSKNPSEFEVWENEHRQQRIDELTGSIDQGEEGALRALQYLLYEECFGVNAHPDQRSDWWKKQSAAPTPGGEISHSYPMSIEDGNRIEDCVNISFSGSTARDMVRSCADSKGKVKIAAMIVQISIPDEMTWSYEVKRNLEKQLLQDSEVSPRFVDLLDTVGARYLTVAKVGDLGGNVKDLEVLKTLRLTEDREISKLLAWKMLWNNFDRSLISNTGGYKQVAEAEVKEEIGKLLRIRLSPDFQGLFRHFSLSGYEIKSKETNLR